MKGLLRHSLLVSSQHELADHTQNDLFCDVILRVFSFVTVVGLLLIRIQLPGLSARSLFAKEVTSTLLTQAKCHIMLRKDG